MQDSDDIFISTSTSQESIQREGPPLSEDAPRGFFADQFENIANFSAHFESTGPEIWRQTNGNIDAFVSGAGEIPFQSGTEITVLIHTADL